MADRNDNLGGSRSGSDDSIDNPDRNRDEGLSGSSTDRSRERGGLDPSQTERDQSDVSGDELGGNREGGRTGTSGTTGSEEGFGGSSRTGGSNTQSDRTSGSEGGSGFGGSNPSKR